MQQQSPYLQGYPLGNAPSCYLTHQSLTLQKIHCPKIISSATLWHVKIRNVPLLRARLRIWEYRSRQRRDYWGTWQSIEEIGMGKTWTGSKAFHWEVIEALSTDLEAASEGSCVVFQAQPWNSQNRKKGEEWNLRVTVLPAEECKSQVEKIAHSGKEVTEVAKKTEKIIFKRVKRQREDEGLWGKERKRYSKSGEIIPVALHAGRNLVCPCQGLCVAMLTTGTSLSSCRSKEIEAVGCNGDAAFLEVRVQQLVIEFILNHVDQIFTNNRKASSAENIGSNLPEPLPMSLAILFNSPFNQYCKHSNPCCHHRLPQRYLEPYILLFLSSTFSFWILASFSVFSGCLMSHLLHDLMWLNPFHKRETTWLIINLGLSFLSESISHSLRSSLRFLQLQFLIPTIPALQPLFPPKSEVTLPGTPGKKINLVLQKLLSCSRGHFITEIFFFLGTSIVFRDADFAV